MEQGQLKFKNDEVEKTFLSLSTDELNEFKSDLLFMITESLKVMEMQDVRVYSGHHYMNQRLSKRNFRVEIYVDFTPNQEKVILIEQFKEMNMDEYLDSINNDKGLAENGFIKLK